jgi:hypothetical protein
MTVVYRSGLGNFQFGTHWSNTAGMTHYKIPIFRSRKKQHTLSSEVEHKDPRMFPFPLPESTRVYGCLQVSTDFYRCLLLYTVYTVVYCCLLLSTVVYCCLLLSTVVNRCLPMFTLIYFLTVFSGNFQSYHVDLTNM